jgi:hypothetical protein
LRAWLVQFSILCWGACGVSICWPKCLKIGKCPPTHWTPWGTKIWHFLTNHHNNKVKIQNVITNILYFCQNWDILMGRWLVLNVDVSKIIILQLNNCQLSILSIKTIKKLFWGEFWIFTIFTNTKDDFLSFMKWSISEVRI